MYETLKTGCFVSSEGGPKLVSLIALGSRLKEGGVKEVPTGKRPWSQSRGESRTEVINKSGT